MLKEVQSRLRPGATPMEQLRVLVDTFPQRPSPHDKPAYLPTSGIAVELVTGHVRDHDDLDILVCDGSTKKWGDLDVFTPGNYLAGMRFEPEFFQQTAVEVPLREGEWVSVVHPGIIMVQKATRYPYGGRMYPREQDLDEVTRIMKYWQNDAPNPKSWDIVVKGSLLALPPQRRMPTLQRLNNLAHKISR